MSSGPDLGLELALLDTVLWEATAENAETAPSSLPANRSTPRSRFLVPHPGFRPEGRHPGPDPGASVDFRSRTRPVHRSPVGP